MDYQYMLPTEYDGGSLEPMRYTWLEQLNPEQEMYSGTFMYSYSTIKLYKENKAKLPMEALLTYTQPIVGKNITVTKIVQAELKFYF